MVYFYTVTWHALHTSMLLARERGQRFAGFEQSRYARAAVGNAFPRQVTVQIHLPQADGVGGRVAGRHGRAPRCCWLASAVSASPASSSRATPAGSTSTNICMRRGVQRVPGHGVKVDIGEVQPLRAAVGNAFPRQVTFYTVTWHALHTSMLLARERGQRFAGFEQSRYASGAR
jgi:hypothetical protein